MDNKINPLHEIGVLAKEASYSLATLNTAERNSLLLDIASSLEVSIPEIIAANAIDMKRAAANGLSGSMQDRLLLNDQRLMSIISDIRNVVSLPDPVGKVLDGRELDTGLSLIKRSVPLGVIGVIYEARPNVTVDIASLCLKTGNAAILRGGSETIDSNKAIVNAIKRALKKSGVDANSIQLIENTDRALVEALLHLDDYVDMIIPRGGAGLHKMCKENSRIPVIIGGVGVCHIVVDISANLEKAIDVIINAKTQRPSTCNTVETVLVLSDLAPLFLPQLASSMEQNGVTLHCDERSKKVLSDAGIKCESIHEGDLDKEWLSLDLNLCLVDDLDAAIAHIRKHGTAHSDAIITETMTNADKFVNKVDSSAVYVNASTRFTDGAQFGLGAEVAISTQKLHARGPMGLDALTTYKWICHGNYTLRP